MLTEAGCAGTVSELAERARTSAEAATALGVEIGQIAKSLVFAAGDSVVLVVASGADRVDTGAVFPTTYDELLRLTRGAPADVRERRADEAAG